MSPAAEPELILGKPKLSAGQLAMLVASDVGLASSQTIANLAAEHGVSHTYMQYALTVLRDAPRLVEPVLSGEMGLDVAWAHARGRRLKSAKQPNRTKEGKHQRDEQIRQMTDQGYSETDIANAVGLTLESLHTVMYRRLHIPTLRRKLGVSARVNSDKVMDSLVAGAMPPLDAVDAVDWDALDPSRLELWERGLNEAIGAWSAVRNRIKRRKSNGT